MARGAITFNADIDRLVGASGIDLGQVDITGTPAQRWSKAVGRIVLEGKFHLLLTASPATPPTRTTVQKSKDSALNMINS